MPPFLVAATDFLSEHWEAFSLSAALYVCLKAYGVNLALLLFLQRKLLFVPHWQAADPEIYGGRLLQLPGQGSEKLAALFYPPRHKDSRILVFFHGNGDQLGWAPAELGDCITKDFDVGFLAIEYPGYGYASGHPSEDSITEASKRWIQHFTKEQAVPISNIVLFGHSIGAGVAVEMARRGLGGRLVLVSPFTSVMDMASSVYPVLQPIRGLLPLFVMDKFDNKAKLPKLKIPTLIIHGTTDEIVPYQQGQALANSQPLAEFRPFRGLGHNDILGSIDVIREIVRFATTAQ